MVTILTTRFKVQKFYVLPTQCIYIFCMDVRTAIISLYNINWLVYLRRSVFTERYGLYPGPNSSGLYWTLPWIRRLVAGLSPRRCAFNPSSFNVRFVVEKVALWRVFPPTFHTHFHLRAMLSRRTNGRSPGTFQKAMLFRKSGSIG